MVHAITGWILAIIGARLHYVVSRRKMLLGYTMGMVVCLRSLLGQLLGMRKRVVRRCRLLPSPSLTLSKRSLPSPLPSVQPIYPWEVLSSDMRARAVGVFPAHRRLRWLSQYFCRPGGAQQGWYPGSSLSALASA